MESVILLFFLSLSIDPSAFSILIVIFLYNETEFLQIDYAPEWHQGMHRNKL